MFDCFLFSTSKTNNQKPLLTNYATTTASNGVTPTKSMTLILQSWLNGNRFRYVILLLFSPLLIPFIFVISPLLFAAEVYFRLRRFKSVPPPQPPDPAVIPAPAVLRRKDDQVNLNLLDRYLDDQLELALEILDECGGELGLAYCSDYDYDYDYDYNDFNRSNTLC